MPRRIELTGRIFGRWSVIGSSETIFGGKRAWDCKCSCGVVRAVRGSDLRMGKSISCGCHRLESVMKHGHLLGAIKTSEYNSWVAMIQRCTNPTATEFAQYGGRGISVCDRWRKSFADFINDMGLKPSKGMSIDRIDVNGNYEPSNCRWATKREQGNNRRDNRVATYQGRTQTVLEWCRELGVSHELVRGRIRNCESFESAISRSSNRIATRKNITGERFGSLVAVSYSHTTKTRAYWNCRCDCGRSVVSMGKDLRQGKTVSCGCKRGRRPK